MRSWMTFKDRVRYFNKRFLNRFTMTFAGRRRSPYTVMYHVGRISGRTYATPVLAMLDDAHFIIPLPYGKDVDWCRNIMAADGCLVEYQGAVYRAADPEIISPEAGLPAFPAWIQDLLRRDETEYFLRLRHGEQVSPQDPAYEYVCVAHADDTKVLAILAVTVVSLIAVWVMCRRKEG